MRDTTTDTDELSGTYATVVGARLRAVRRQKRLSLQAVAAASGQEFKASVLGAYERGERAISVPRLQRLARLYDVPVEQLLPEAVSDGAGLGTTRDTSGGGRVSIDLGAVKEASGDLAAALQRFVTTIQVERQDFNGQVLTIRSDDLRVIGATFGMGVDETVRTLESLGLLYAP
ncbi:MAG TPA: transcriptional regulator [Acidimicrobiales bacterium]|nr:transcriptional regulator [Acidimicrobiales bacterium]